MLFIRRLLIPLYRYNETNYTQISENYGKSIKNYTTNVFVVLSIIGLASTICGVFISKMETIDSGFIGGGILTILLGIVVGWVSINKYLRIAILGLVLAFLIYLAYRKLEKK